ncbi:MAG: polyprenyl synthetase family protein [Candidatus Pacebacteria bacterium]|nr:polyprenyl synthetase family protein [Candidatus Paceibacterota bacterium]
MTKDLKNIFSKTTKNIEPTMKKIMDSYVDSEFQELVEYQISNKGKKVRPALAIISCLLLRGKIKDVLYPAAGLEILHNYTLIIDDIIDSSTFRRNKLTTWRKFGKSIAECIGVDYSASVFQAANNSKKPVEVSKIFSKTIKTMVNGEFLDILFELNKREGEPFIKKKKYKIVDLDDYYEMAGKKTAILFQACCEIGAVCSDVTDKKIINSLGRYGYNLGIAFQIQDDILDILGNKKKLGKEIGKDIKERKRGNIVILLAAKELGEIDTQKIFSIMKKKNILDKDVQRVIKLIKQTNALEESIKLSQKFVDKAKSYLKCLPKNKYRDLLEDIANYTINRKR